MQRDAVWAVARRSNRSVRRWASGTCVPPAVGEVRLVGDPILSQKSRVVGPENAEEAEAASASLHQELAAFREQHGFGRAIAAPQVGFSLRILAMDLGKGAFTLYNPVLFDHSAETITLWDDCMSFPDLLVRVRRHKSVSLRFHDGEQEQVWEDLDPALSELLQHEVDHLDGITSFDRADGPGAVVHRSVYEARREALAAQVTHL